jgi:hypothetical protein
MLPADLPLVPAAYRGDRDRRPIRIELPLHVAAVDGRGPGLTAADAVERMLAHPQLALLVAEPDSWPSARLGYRDGVWELRAQLRAGGVIVARIGDGLLGAPTVAFEAARRP